MNNLFVVGTDTDVGKSVLSLLLVQFFYKKGYKPFYIKPFQTGCKDPYDTDSDAKFVYSHTAELKDKDPAESVIFCFNNPKAPLFAARDDKTTVNYEAIENLIKEKSSRHSPIILEAAGGILVPASDDLMMIDVIEKTQAKPIIAARAGLGTINHTLLTIEVLKSRGIEPLGIILLDAGETPTSEEAIQENIEAIEKFSGIKVGGTVSKIEDFANPEQYEVLEELFPEL